MAMRIGGCLDRSERSSFVQRFRQRGRVAWPPSGDEVWYAATGNRGLGRCNSCSPHLRAKSGLFLRLPGCFGYMMCRMTVVCLISRESWRSGLQFRGPETKERDLSWLDYAQLRIFSPGRRADRRLTIGISGWRFRSGLLATSRWVAGRKTGHMVCTCSLPRRDAGVGIRSRNSGPDAASRSAATGVGETQVLNSSGIRQYCSEGLDARRQDHLFRER